MDSLAEHREQRARRRLACTIGQATLHADTDEYRHLQALLLAVDRSLITVDQAQTAAANVQRDQQARRAA